MSQLPESRRPGPPHNPGVRDLIEGKRRWSSPAKPENMKQGFRGWHERGYLPHRDEPGLTQFVTFHLADSFPESLRSEWEHLLKLEDDHERRKELEAYLDRGRGACHLRRAEIAQLIEDGFQKFHGKRYELRAWVMMPNHVHVLFKVGSTPMAEMVGAWKRYTGRLANKLLRKRGGFWAEDYFDTFMRDAEHERKTVRYIENNPAKAKLTLDPKSWPWSSARFRDELGELRLSGARLSEPQQRPNDESASDLFQRACSHNIAAGRRPALRPEVGTSRCEPRNGAIRTGSINSSVLVVRTLLRITTRAPIKNAAVI